MAIEIVDLPIEHGDCQWYSIVMLNYRIVISEQIQLGLNRLLKHAETLVAGVDNFTQQVFPVHLQIPRPWALARVGFPLSLPADHPSWPTICFFCLKKRFIHLIR